MTADLLREAAAVLRERAQAATPGPWRSTEYGIEAGRYDEVITLGPLSCMSYCYADPSTVECEPADASYIATMHPGVGLALADWLEAMDAEWTTSDRHTATVSEAFAVARAILGRDA